MSKLIDQQVVIDAVKAMEDKSGKGEIAGFYNVILERVIDKLNNLPSAQPENIRCYECKYGTHSGCGNVYICNVSLELVMKHTGDFCCGYAERRTNELGDS